VNPYTRFVSDYARLVQDAKSFPLGGFPPAARPTLPPDAPKALFFAPHPDDECIAGGLALRLMREAPMNLINVAVTQGSKRERQAERFRELQSACDYLGFGLRSTGPNSLEKINPKSREQDREHWAKCVNIIVDILTQANPRVIFFPHQHDWNSTHIGTHFLVMDALELMPRPFECYLVETEFWGQMGDPNLMVEISAADLSDLVIATTFHVGEVQRNPYHLLLPAWMMDNVRRGSELVGGQGGRAPDFAFASLYRLREWTRGGVTPVLSQGTQISAATNVRELFP
jgi:LmbE family N-acetylglucosaminyl deacetylase